MFEKFWLSFNFGKGDNLTQKQCLPEKTKSMKIAFLKLHVWQVEAEVPDLFLFLFLFTVIVSNYFNSS